MLDAMDQVIAESGPVAAFPFAQACAPFMHAKLGMVNMEHAGPGGGPVQFAAVDLSGATTEQLRALASLKLTDAAG